MGLGRGSSRVLDGGLGRCYDIVLVSALVGRELISCRR